MKKLYSEIEIDAPAQRVWDLLTDFAAYPDWNPFIPRIAGALETGATLEVRLEPPDGMAITMRPTLLAVTPRQELRWLGKFLLSGLFDGEHRFAIEPLDNGRVRLVHEEQFRGILVPLFASSLDRHTLRGFQAMNQALKARAEATIAPMPTPVQERTLELVGAGTR